MICVEQMHVVFQIKSSCFKQQIIPLVCVVPCSNTTVFEQLAGAELCHPILVMFLILPMCKNLSCVCSFWAEILHGRGVWLYRMYPGQDDKKMVQFSQNYTLSLLPRCHVCGADAGFSYL